MPVLPIDTGKYGLQEMRLIFEEESKLQKWLEIEAAVSIAQATVGNIPKRAAEEIARNANTNTVTLVRTKAIEKEIHHDLFSMVRALSEACSGSGRNYVHYGLTSNDVEDTAAALQFKEAIHITSVQLSKLEKHLTSLARKHKKIPINGKTSGKLGDRIALEFRIDTWLDAIRRHKQRLEQIRERVLVGKILGIVGTGAALGEHALRIQSIALKRLGLKPAGLVTQVVQRDLHAEIVLFLAILTSSLEGMAVEIWDVQRPRVGQVIEPFDSRTHSRNLSLTVKPNHELSENVSSHATLLRALTVPSLENIPLWHERDLSNKASERFLFPMSFILCSEMLQLITSLLEEQRF